jgi:hypothetical protein
MTRTFAAALCAAALAGCASLNTLDTDVSSYSRWPAGRVASTYAFERLPSAQARPQQAQMLEDAAREAIERAGFRPPPEGSAADVTVQVGARIVATDRSPFDDPFWYGPRGVWHRPFVYGRYGRPFWGPYGPGPYGAFGWGPDFPTYEREVAVLIRDKQSGDPLYEARAESEGTSADLARVLPAMFVAAMRDFPVGSPNNPHRVRVETRPAPD